MAIKELTVKKVEAATLGKLLGALNGIVGIFVGTLVSIAAVIGVVSNNNYGVGTDILVSIGILLAGIIAYPVFAYVLGWFQGWLVGIVFNFISGVSGGINIEVEESKNTETKK